MRLYKRGKTWWADFTVDGHRFRQTTNRTDKRAAEAEAKRLQRDEELRASGLLPECAAGAVLPELVEQWAAYLVQRGRAESYAKRARGTVLRFLGSADVRELRDLTLRRAEGWLRGEKEARGWSAGTYNRNRALLRAWGNWLSKRKQVLSINPLDGLETDQGGKTSARRALSPEEAVRLVEVAPWPRNVLYHLVLTTGLRRGEADRLEWRDVAIGKGLIVVRCESSKARREELLPLDPTVGQELAELRRVRQLGVNAPPADVDWVRDLGAAGCSTSAIMRTLKAEGRLRPSRRRTEGKHWTWADVQAAIDAEARPADPGERVFLGEAAKPCAKALDLDLAAAGIPKHADRGKIDFHSLRVTFGTDLRRRGMHPIQIQRLMRHSDPKLTTVTYQDLDVAELRGSVGLRRA